MAGTIRDLLTGVVRETALAALTWLAAVTGLFAAFRLSFGRQLARSRRQNPAASTEVIRAQMYEWYPVEQGPILGQWIEWVVSYTTFGFGSSVQQAEPVSNLFLQGLPKSLLLLVAIVAVAVLMAVPLVAVTTWLDDSVAGTVFAAHSYLFVVSSPLVAGLGVLTVMYAIGGAPTRLNEPLSDALVTNYGLLVPIAVAVATPLVADAVRRVHRDRTASGGIGGLTDVFGPARGGIGTLELWAYGAYLVSSLVVIEQVLAFRGVGWLFYSSVNDTDLPALLGIAGATAFFLVFAAYVRNLVGVVARLLRETGVATSATADDGSHVDGSADAGTVAKTVATRPKFVVGLLVLGLGGLSGLVGSLFLAPERPRLRGDPAAVGFGPGQFFNTLGSLFTVALVASVVALALGASFGLLGGYLRGRVGGPVGELAAIGRVPADLWILAPLVPTVGAWVLVFGGGDSRTGIELTLGIVAGLVLAGYAFVATSAAGSERFRPDRSVTGAAAESLVAGFARIDWVVVTALFAVGEIAFLGVVPAQVAPAFLQLDFGVNGQSLLVGQQAQLVPLLVQGFASVAVPVLGVGLVGDGLGEAAAELRTTGGSPADGESATRASESADARSNVGTKEAA